MSSSTALAGFCENCKAPAKRLTDEKLAERKKLNDTIHITNTELAKVKSALEDANKKAGINGELCDRLKDENEILQELLARAESTSEAVAKGTKDELEQAKARVLELEADNRGLRRYGKLVTQMSFLTGVSAAVAAGIVGFATPYRNVAENVASFAAGALIIGGLLQIGQPRQTATGIQQ